MRFFVPYVGIEGGCITIEGADAVHIGKVLRMRCGDALSICCGDGLERVCRIEAITPQAVTARVEEELADRGEPTVFVTVYAGLSKGERFDYLIQKCVEVGASAIVPFVSRHCVAKPDERDYERKQERFSRIALEASKQAKRGRPVGVGPIVTFEKAVELAAQDAPALLLYEKENGASLSRVLRREQTMSRCSVVTGPEGGFSQEEAALAVQKGLVSVSVGPRILRCETAPVAAVCAVMYQTGNFDIGE